MKVLMLNSHSEGNEFLHQMTVKNHSEYAGRHRYSILNINERYELNLPTSRIKYLLQYWEAVACVGSDVLFTNMGINFMDLCDSSIPLTGGADPCADIPINGDFLIFKRVEGIDSLLDELAEKQRVHSRFGMQDKLCDMYKEGCPHIEVLPPRTLQSFPKNNGILPPARNDCYWEYGDLCVHFVGGSNYQKAIEMLAFRELGMIVQRGPKQE